MEERGFDLDKSREKGSVYKQCLCCCVASTISFTYGLQTGWLSPMISTLEDPENPVSDHPLSKTEISMLGSTMAIVSFAFAIAYSYIADRHGRKLALLVIATFQSLGFAVRLVSSHFAWLMLSQVFCGVGGAGVFSVVPIYTKEVSQDSMRGVLGSVVMLLESFGILTMYLIGYYLDYNTINRFVAWVPVLNVITLFFIPESPAFLVKKNRIEEATKVTASLRGKDENEKSIQQDIVMLKDQVALYDRKSGISLMSLFETKLSRRTLWISTLVLTVVDIGGNYALFTYASIIVKESGVTFLPELQTVLFPAVMIVGSLLSIVTVERFGRKPLLISGLVVNAASFVSLAISQLIYHKGIMIPQWLPTLFIVFSVITYGADLPVPFVVISEITNVQLRAKLLGYLVMYGWLLCFVQSLCFVPILEFLGIYTIFFTFSVLNLGGAVLCYFMMPETKGKTLEQIENEMMNWK